MRRLTGDEQVAAMRTGYPRLRCLAHGRGITVWQGPLTPLDQTYEILIVHYRRRTLGGCDLLNWGIHVTVLSPPLLDADGQESSAIPHVYHTGRRPELCLYDPATDEWSERKLVAETIVPWTSQWLGFYELWRVTGQWSAPSRDHDPPVNETILPPSKLGGVVADTNRTKLVADRMGSYASGVIMRAAAEGRLPSAADWRRDRIPRLQCFDACPPRLSASSANILAIQALAALPKGLTR